MTAEPQNQKGRLKAAQILDSDESIFRELQTHAPGPSGALPVTPAMLLSDGAPNVNA